MQGADPILADTALELKVCQSRADSHEVGTSEIFSSWLSEKPNAEVPVTLTLDSGNSGAMTLDPLPPLLSEAQGYPIVLNEPVLLVGFEDLQGAIPKTTIEAMMTESGWDKHDHSNSCAGTDSHNTGDQ